MANKPTDEALENRIRELEVANTTQTASIDAQPACESRYSEIIQRIAVAIVVHSADSKIIDCNTRAQELLGIPKDHLLGKTASDPSWRFVTAEMDEMPHEQFPVNRVLTTKRPLRDMIVGILRAGEDEPVWVLVNADPMFDGKEEIEQVFVTFIDISEHRKAQEALQKSEQMYRRIIDTISDGLAIAGQDGRIRYTNTSYCEIYGYQKEEMLGLHASQLIHPDYHPLFESFLRELRETGTFAGQSIDVRKDGSTFHADVRGASIQFEGQECSLGVIRDVTDQWKVEETLRRYEHIISSTKDMMSFVDKDYIYRAVNNAYLTNHQKKREEIVGFSIEELMGSKAFHKVVKRNIDGALGGETVQYQSWFDYPEIGRRYMDVTYHPFVGQTGAIDGIVVVVHDMTESKQAEEALRHSQEKFRDLVENINDVIFSSDEKGQLTYISPLIESWTEHKRSEIIGRSLEEFIHPDDVTNVRRILHRRLTGNAGRSEYRLITKSGDILWVRSSSVPIHMGNRVIGLRGVLTDISEKKRLESQLLQAQKMKAVGTLAGGIAHDFNNLLMGIQGNASLVLLDIDPSDPHYERLTSIGEYVQSGAELTKQLLGFARGGKYEVKPTDLNRLIEECAKMFGRTRKDVTIFNKFERDLWTVEVDQRQIEQVMLNLYVNAWQSMTSGGDLFLQTENIELKKDDVKAYGAKAGNYVKVAVTDTGSGIDNSIQDRIFDPFFTTKDKGRGTGLGLASAYGIIKNHGGIITVDSEIGVGTTFSIFLPASGLIISEDKAGEGIIVSGNETILLIDDEQMIIDVGKNLLEKMGYTVIVAKSGLEALHVYEKAYDRIDLVILDMIMPEMSGGDTYERLKQVNPAIKVILASGFSIDAKAREILDGGNSAFIQKPYGLTEMSRKIREFLDDK